MTKPKIETQDLYSAKDISVVRSILTKEQKGLSTLTGLPLDQPVTDHLHDIEQFVRAVINSKENVALGAIENLYVRYVKYWYSGTYPEFLRQVADYLEAPVDRRFRHSGWLNKAKVEFNKLSEGKKDKVLIDLGKSTGTNGAERKKLFAQAILNKDLGYNAVFDAIRKHK